MPLVLSGQISLIDKLLFHTSRPFASRVVGRSHMGALQRDHMAAYLAHHIAIVGGSPEVFAEDAVTAIHQNSGGLLRRTGNLARGALLAAADEKCPTLPIPPSIFVLQPPRFCEHAAHPYGRKCQSIIQSQIACENVSG